MRNLAQTAFLMAVLTLISKMLGFVRETVMAGFFGASYITDAYVLATSIPNMIFAGIFAAIATAYMPTYSRAVELKGEGEGDRFTSEVINILLTASLLSSVVGLVFSDQIVSVFASGFEGETAKLTGFFVKITFSYCIFTSLADILENYLRYKNVFLAQIVIGYTQNLVIIMIIIISAYSTYHLLAFGLMIAYAIRLILIWRISKKRGFRYQGKLPAKATIKQMSILALPVFLGSSVSQINLFVDKTLASGLTEGSASALNYANLVVTLISGLTVTILTTVTYPKLNQAKAQQEMGKFNDILSTGINLILIVTIPFTLGSILFHNQVVQVIYERGAFDVAATAMTSTAFLYYGLGLIFVSLNTLLIQAYYSHYDSKTPLLYGLCSVAVNIILNLILVRFMQHNGLALATSVANLVSTMLLYVGIRKKYSEIQLIRSWKKIAAICVASTISVAAALFVYYGIGELVWMPRMILLGIAVVISGICYLILLKLLKISEITLLSGIIKR